MDYLQGDQLFRHVRALADNIGPRPPGHPQEEQARQYIRQTFQSESLETFQFPTPDTWGYGMIAPLLLSLVGNVSSRIPVLGRLPGGLLSLFGAAEMWKMTTARPQMLSALYPTRTGGSVLVRIQPSGAIKHKVVLIGHTDTNKHRATFSPQLKRTLQLSSSFLLVTACVNVLISLLGIKRARNLSAALLGFGTATLLADERDGFVDGANDNASAVACVMGIGQQALQTPLQETELWLAFTGSEEVGHIGLNAILDQHGEELRDAWFIDFELVGSGRIVYVTRHGGLTYFNPYTPDAESVQLAQATACQHPDMGVTGQEVVILEEVATLRRRGFRGICLVGVDEHGWLANWHQYSDDSAHIQPSALEKAARFAWAMIETLEKTNRRSD